MSKFRILICSFLILATENLNEVYEGYFIWNVGQGQWVTYIQGQSCIHFDMGGEGKVPKGPLALCNTKKNIVYFTHFDQDHIRWAVQFQQLFNSNQFCWAKNPGQNPPLKKQDYFNRLNVCKKSDRPEITTISKHTTLADTENDKGWIYLLNRQFLIPGDQSFELEHVWAPATRRRLNIDLPGVFLLPHHGSKNSLGISLLQNVPMKLGIASARAARYGHPHASTKQRLSQKGIAIMTTETFGSIFIPINWK